jgi:predicted kinase
LWSAHVLIILAGLPGSGKSTLGRELARRTGATYLRIDTMEQAIVRSSLGVPTAEEAGYLAGYAVAVDNLRLGRTVVADSVNSIGLSRTGWHDTAAEAGCTAMDVEVICSDPVEHRRRVETRAVDIEGLTQPTWQEVVDREYDPWDQDHVIIDTAGRDVAQCIDELLARLP